jgi:hypothetical protein
VDDGVAVLVYVGVDVRVKVEVDDGVKEGVPPHTTETEALLDTAPSLSPFTKAVFLVMHGQLLPAVTQYVKVPHWFICIAPTFHCRVRVVRSHDPISGWAVDVTKPPKLRHAGRESVTTTPVISRPGIGPLPKTLRQQ